MSGVVERGAAQGVVQRGAVQGIAPGGVLAGLQRGAVVGAEAGAFNLRMFCPVDTGGVLVALVAITGFLVLGGAESTVLLFLLVVIAVCVTAFIVMTSQAREAASTERLVVEEPDTLETQAGNGIEDTEEVDDTERLLQLIRKSRNTLWDDKHRL